MTSKARVVKTSAVRMIGIFMMGILPGRSVARPLSRGRKIRGAHVMATIYPLRVYFTGFANNLLRKKLAGLKWSFLLSLVTMGGSSMARRAESRFLRLGLVAVVFGLGL